MSTIAEVVEKTGLDISSVELYQSLDKQDKFSKFRQEFAIPQRRSVSGSNPISGNVVHLVILLLKY